MLKLTTICAILCYNNKLQLLADANNKYKKLISALDSTVELLIYNNRCNFKQIIKPKSICEYSDYLIMKYYYDDFERFFVNCDYVTVALFINNEICYNAELYGGSKKYINSIIQSKNKNIVANIEIQKSVGFDWFIYL